MHDFFMKKALNLAKLGAFHASPNPMVGCVIVHDGKIIGQGYHRKAGTAHAEVNAIQDVKDQSLLSEATAYVSLEPCAHFGKTPPCADLLIEHSLKEVVIAMKDPFPKVDGLGIKKLKDAGIKVHLNVLKDEAQELNKRFITFYSKKRPYIILKWAESFDGFIAPLEQKPGEMSWISHPSTQEYSHLWRAEEDAILVGFNTVLKDNPSLTCRAVEGPNPLRIIIDPQDQINSDAKVFNDENYWIFSQPLSSSNGIKNFLSEAYEKNILSILVEGGAKTHEAFLKHNCWDEIRVFKSRNKLGQGIKAAQIPTNAVLVHAEQLIKDQLKVFKP